LNAAAGAGLAAVIGAEVSALDEASRVLARASGLRGGRSARASARPRVQLIPFDRRGWANLCAVLTARHLDDAFDLARCVGEHHAGLHVVAESPGLATALMTAGVPPAVSASDEIARGLTRRGARASAGGLWLGVRGIAAERPRLRERLEESWRMGVPAVATGDVWMLEPRDHEAHRAAVTAAAGELLERMPPDSFCAREAWLASPAEWERRVRAVCGGAGCAEQAEPLLENNAALVARCHLNLEMGTPIFPRAPLPDGVTGSERLRELALEGLRRRYPASGTGRASGAARAQALARLESELALIEHMGFTDYFLLVASIVGFARERGIPTVGRGSGASSIVSYTLGVTSVDPVRHGLCFERFLHPQRRDCPDLDVDLCWRRRDEVIAHVYDAYGHDRVAMISTHATLGPRSAFREAAKALGVPLPRVNALAKRVPRHLDASALEQVLERGVVTGAAGPRGDVGRAPAAGGPDAGMTERARSAGAGPGAGPGLGPHDFGPEFREPRIAEALRLAARLAGAPRHLSVHCGGLVIGDRALTHYLPLERAAKGVVVSQFEMRAVEAIGLVKMDLLGNRAITTIGECVALSSGRLDPDTVPDDDPTAAAAIAAGDTLNCFQLESPAMRNLLRMLRARTLEDTVAAVALVRPGPAESGMKEAFCRRRRGLEPVTYPHERLRATLAETQGILLYEEDVMRVAAALCGLPLAEGETLRRAIAHSRSDEEFRFLERGFVAQACARASPAGRACRVARAGAVRGLCLLQAHAAGYGLLAGSAALKAPAGGPWACSTVRRHVPHVGARRTCAAAASARTRRSWRRAWSARRGTRREVVAASGRHRAEVRRRSREQVPVDSTASPGSLKPPARASSPRGPYASPPTSPTACGPPQVDALIMAGALDALAAEGARPHACLDAARSPRAGRSRTRPLAREPRHPPACSRPRAGRWRAVGTHRECAAPGRRRDPRPAGTAARRPRARRVRRQRAVVLGAPARRIRAARGIRGLRARRPARAARGQARARLRHPVCGTARGGQIGRHRAVHHAGRPHRPRRVRAVPRQLQPLGHAYARRGGARRRACGRDARRAHRGRGPCRATRRIESRGGLPRLAGRGTAEPQPRGVSELLGRMNRVVENWRRTGWPAPRSRALPGAGLRRGTTFVGGSTR
jgi:DNA-directed DNA polymerase III PolC